MNRTTKYRLANSLTKLDKGSEISCGGNQSTGENYRPDVSH
jgi:hypothetical protein